jgi:phosphatidylglycerophosphatase A
MNKVAKTIILFISQGSYAGRFPVAPGTAGTVVGVFLYLGMKGLAPAHYLAICVLLFLVGTWSAGRAEVILGSTDSPSIVIDEITGYLVAMILVPTGWLFIISGFILFRVFDILKPWPLKHMQNLHGGLGVMLDDIGAGVYTNIILQCAVFLISR